jgi:hypothetical protein
MGNAIQAAAAVSIQADIDARLAAVPVDMKVNGFIVSNMIDTYIEAVARLKVREDNTANREAAAAAGTAWESFRFEGRKAFASAHDAKRTVDPKTKKVTTVYVYNAAKAMQVIVEFEKASKVLEALQAIATKVTSKLNK